MHFSKPLALRAMLVLLTLLGTNLMASEESATQQSRRAITLQDAISRALENHPGINAAQLDVEIQRLHRDVASVSPGYVLRTDVENFAGSGALSGVDAAEATVQVSKVIEFGDKRRYRTELADAKIAKSKRDQTLLSRQLAADVARRYLVILKKQAQRQLTQQAVDKDRRTRDIVEKRIRAGRASSAERSTALVALSRNELIINRLDYELEGSRVQLATTWGSVTPNFDEAIGDIYATPTIPPFAELAARLELNPKILEIATEAQIKGAELRVAQSKQTPDVELSAGVRHLAEVDDSALVFSFSLPIGSRGRGEPVTRATKRALQQIPLRREVRMLTLQATLSGFYQSLLAAQNELNVLRSQIIPEAENAVTVYERGFELGSTSLLELLAAQKQLVDLKKETLDTAASFHLTLIEIESLLGNTNPGGALK